MRLLLSWGVGRACTSLGPNPSALNYPVPRPLEYAVYLYIVEEEQETTKGENNFNFIAKANSMNGSFYVDVCIQVYIYIIRHMSKPSIARNRNALKASQLQQAATSLVDAAIQNAGSRAGSRVFGLACYRLRVCCLELRHNYPELYV